MVDIAHNETRLAHNDQWARFQTWDSKTSKIFSYLTLGIAFVGLVGNILCAKVLGKVQKTVTGVRLIRYLTVVDIMVIVLLVLPSVIENLVGIQYPHVMKILDCARFLLTPSGETVYTFEIYLTVLIAFERCLALAIPHWFQRFMRDSVMKKILIGIAISAVTLHIPTWLTWIPRFYWNRYYNMTLIRTIPTLPSEFEFYWIRTLMIFGHGIPVLVLAISTIILIISRRRMTRVGDRGDRIGANQLTAIVLAIAVMSCVVHFLSLGSFIAQGYKNYFWIYRSRYSNNILLLTMRFFKVLLICTNSSTNFIFYCTFGREFRRTLMAMFKRGTSHQQTQHVAIELGEIHTNPCILST